MCVCVCVLFCVLLCMTGKGVGPKAERHMAYSLAPVTHSPPPPSTHKNTQTHSNIEVRPRRLT